mgnify:CR=1 FL=1|uniref:Uncharacterized protein n=1 Tax=Myoviridae sp. ctRci5 TaxID=2825105 RepID=A0A8S5V6T2_9CAUD|nr:MAG TPA: hypothetical protein [Myoviridae sp. ctRci5]
MNFEEKMKLAVAMAEFRISKTASGEALSLGRAALPNAATYEQDGYVQAVKGMFNLIQDLERQHNQSLNG